MVDESIERVSFRRRNGETVELPEEEGVSLESVLPRDATTLVVTIRSGVRHVLQCTALATRPIEESKEEQKDGELNDLMDTELNGQTDKQVMKRSNSPSNRQSNSPSNRRFSNSLNRSLNKSLNTSLSRLSNNSLYTSLNNSLNTSLNNPVNTSLNTSLNNSLNNSLNTSLNTSLNNSLNNSSNNPSNNLLNVPSIHSSSCPSGSPPRGQSRSAFITTLTALAMSVASPSLFIDPSIVEEKGQSDTPVHLEACLQNYFRREILDFNADYTCEKCRRVVELVRDLQMVHPPFILILHLMRFAFDVNGAVKIYENVRYPLHVSEGSAFHW